jgi:hypothetical protein
MSHDTEATSSKRKYDSAIDTSCAFETNDLNLTFMHPAGLSKIFKCTSTSLFTGSTFS